MNKSELLYYLSGYYKEHVDVKLPVWYEHKNDLKSYDTQVKIYKNGVIKIKIFKDPIILNSHAKINRSARTEKVTRQKEINTITKTNIYDLAMNNTFNYFITLTFNSDVVDRYSFKETSKKVRKFMNNYSRVDPDFKYLIVYETHKDGAYHYHGLLNINDETKMKSSGIYQKGQLVYNWQNWKNGFSTCTKIKDHKRVSRYIMKYITKTPRYAKGIRKYYYSSNLEKPVIIKKNLDQLSAIKLDNKIYESDFSIGFEYNMIDLLNNI